VRPPRLSRESGIAVYVAAAMLVLIVPMVGLAIDSTLLYIVKTRLQGAVDGAALAASRSLARGADGTTQRTAAVASAQTYVMLNYPSGYFFGNNIVIDSTNGINIDLSIANQRTITVTASVVEPTLFMRWLNFSSTTVVASAQTVRKDVNVVLVLDRSGSMTASGSCNPMKAAAINFVQNFAPGRDNVGIVTFATSVVVQMPLTQTFKAFDHTGTGIDPQVAINGMQCQGSTSSAAALWNAYNQLANLNQPAALNYIVFFTDGEPTGIDAYMPITAASPCSAATTATSTTPGMIAGYGGKYIRGMYATFTNNSAFIGNAYYSGVANSDGTPPASTLPSVNDQVVAPNSTGCAYAANFTNGSPSLTISDFRGLPLQDVYGSSTNTGFQAITLNAAGWIDIGNHLNGIPLALNAADDAARRIRNGTVSTMTADPVNNPIPNRGLNGVIIHSIGLGNANPPLPNDGIFLNRVSNTVLSQTYDSTKGSGRFIYVQESSDLGSAFNQIASEILRLAK